MKQEAAYNNTFDITMITDLELVIPLQQQRQWKFHQVDYILPWLSNGSQKLKTIIIWMDTAEVFTTVHYWNTSLILLNIYTILKKKLKYMHLQHSKMFISLGWMENFKFGIPGSAIQV